MGKKEEINFKIDDVVFDTAKSLIEMVYDPKSGDLFVWVSSYLSETPFEDKSIKKAVLDRLYNAGTALGDFLVEKLKKGSFDDITDSEG